MAETSADSTPAPPPARLNVRQREGFTMISFVSPRIDGNTVRELYETAVVMTYQRNVKLLIDFSDVILVTSGAMGILITIKKKFLSVGGQLHLLVADPNVRTQFEVMNLHLILQMFDNAEAAQQFKR